MKLWTPGKPRIARPHVCGRCGCLRREWAREDRWRRFLSMHRVCCCGNQPTCEDLGVSSLEVTISGVEAARCTGCYQRGSLQISREHTELSGIDGTFRVPFVGTINFGQICQFRLNSSDGYMTSNEYGDDSCGVFDRQGEWITAHILIEYDTNTGTFNRLRVEHEDQQTSGIGGAGTWAFRADSGGYSFDSAIPNEASCEYRRSSNGGTMTVASP